jgi:energy-coupling factor transporter ATP-binding protein EcfA2
VINTPPKPTATDAGLPVESNKHSLTVGPEGPNLTQDHVLPSIRLRGVHKNFGRVRAVRGVDLTVHPGEVLAFLGPNGAGKTTTIDMMLGLSQPSSGTVEVYGMPPADAVSRGLVTAVMQTGGLLRDLTVTETVRLIATLFADSRPVDEVLRRAGIADIAGRRVGKAPADSSNGCASPSRYFPIPSCSCSTSPPRAWTSKAVASSGRPSARTQGVGAPCSSPRTTWRRPTRTPTGSCS